MTVVLPIERPRAQVSAWRNHLVALALVWASVLALFHREATGIVSIWWNSSTFNHCLLIPPIIAWLVAQRLPELRLLRPAAWGVGLAFAAAGAFAWLVGDAAGIDLARHTGLIVMLQGAVVACLGREVARGLVFPIFYALFLIPVGEEFVPALQTLTAQLAMGLLDLSGVPAHLEGVFITTGFGYFEVAEACAGVKFLVAMVAFGALVGNVCFRSWPRRTAFMAVSIVVPILANGVRAWGTILIARESGLSFAESFDHVVYGGIFFALVIGIVIAAAWPFFDRGVDDPWLGPRAPGLAGRAAPLGWVAAAAVALAALPPVWMAAVAAGGTQRLPSEIAMPQVTGWQQVPRHRGIGWRPEFAKADLVRITHYRDSRGRTVDLAVAVYAHQAEGRDLVGFGQGAAAGWAWSGNSEAPLNGRAERVASHGLVREVATFYRIGGLLTGSALGVKLETIKTRLLGGPQRAVAVLVSAPAPAAGVSPRPVIDDFLSALGPIDSFADRAAGLGNTR